LSRRATPGLLRARRDRESGQALLELALVVPILVLLVMAIFQFAFVIESQMGLTNAVREAARRAAATPTKAPVWTGSGTSFEAWVQTQLCGDTTPPCTGGLLPENVQAFDGTKLVIDPPTVAFCRYLVGTTTNYRVTVTVAYQHPVFFGPLAYATDFIDGTPDGYWNLSAQAEMRLENIDPTAPGYTDPGVCT